MGAPWRAMGGRFALTLGGEVVQSAFHFGLNVVLARTIGAEDYGVFAIVMLIGGIGLTYVRALVGMPVTLLISQRRGSRAARAIEAAFGSAALCLAVLMAVLTAALLRLWLRADVLSGASFVGLWCFRSYLRTMLLAERRQKAAGSSDLTLAVVGAALAALLVRRDAAHPLETVFFLLGGANLAAIAVALAARALPLRITFRPSMRRRFGSMRHQIAWSAAGTTTANAQAQGQVLLVASFAGPKAYAPIAAMVVLFAPMRLLAAALANIVQPELATRAARGGLPGLRRMAVLWTGFALLVGLLYGAVAVAAVPLMGARVFEGQSRLVLGLLVWGVTTTFLQSLLPRLFLEVLREFRLAALITAVSAVIGMAAAGVLLATASPTWTLLGNLLAEGIVLVWSWIAVARAWRSRAGGLPVPAGAVAEPSRRPARTGLPADAMP